MYEMTEADRVSTELVARWILQFDVNGTPEDARAAVNLVLLDTLGVMLASTRYEVGKSIIRGVMGLSAGGEVVVPGTDARVDVVSGALIYGTLGHGIELDEVHLRSRQHVGATVGAAALALGQHRNASLAQLREALLVGYEIAGHLGIAVDNNKLLDRNFHLTGVVSGLECSAAAARLLGLSAEETYNALGLTASQASGTLAWHTESHHMSKSFQCGLAARNGLTAALLAQQGYQGPPAVFAGPYNVFQAFRGEEPDPNWFRRLGKEFEICNSSMKLYAAGRPMHAALDALFDIMKRESIQAEEIEAMEVRMNSGDTILNSCRRREGDIEAWHGVYRAGSGEGPPAPRHPVRQPAARERKKVLDVVLDRTIPWWDIPSSTPATPLVFGSRAILAGFF